MTRTPGTARIRTTDPNADAARRVGTTLRNKWTLEKLLGVGGMAAVYVAAHKIGRREAIKILHPDVVADPEMRLRFEQEAHAVNRFKHPGAVEIRDIDTTEDGAPFLVMELLEGESLGDRARRLGGIETGELLGHVEELLDVLASAHAQGIIHRDIKLDNLFVQSDGHLKVLDFGIARMREGSPGKMKTRVGTALGTAAYMPPEQVKGLDIDARADLFAVGATMFRLLSKRRIHEAPTDLEMRQKMAREPAPPLASVAPDAPGSVCLVVDRALMFDRDRRYPDALTMQADIRAIRAGKSPPYASQLADRPAPTVSDPELAAGLRDAPTALPTHAPEPTLDGPARDAPTAATKGTGAATGAAIAAANGANGAAAGAANEGALRDAPTAQATAVGAAQDSIVGSHAVPPMVASSEAATLPRPGTLPVGPQRALAPTAPNVVEHGPPAIASAHVTPTLDSPAVATAAGHRPETTMKSEAEPVAAAMRQRPRLAPASPVGGGTAPTPRTADDGHGALGPASHTHVSGAAPQSARGEKPYVRVVEPSYASQPMEGRKLLQLVLFGIFFAALGVVLTLWLMRKPKAVTGSSGAAATADPDGPGPSQTSIRNPQPQRPTTRSPSPAPQFPGFGPLPTPQPQPAATQPSPTGDPKGKGGKTPKGGGHKR